MALGTIPGIRTFSHGSALADDGLTLDLAPALTPTGLVDRPGFFHGFAAHPVVVTRSLLVLADIASARYLRPAPVGVRDPVLTANGDRLRVECFSACNWVLARLDLLASGLDGGRIGHGTTNVDIGPAMRRALARVPRGGLLHLDVGTDRLRASTPAESVEERRVQMPDRWVRALGNAAELTQPLTERLSVEATGARRFVQALPRAGATRTDRVRLSAARGQLVTKPHRTPGGVRLMGAHRLAAVTRLLVNLEGLTVYAPADGTRYTTTTGWIHDLKNERQRGCTRVDSGTEAWLWWDSRRKKLRVSDERGNSSRSKGPLSNGLAVVAVASCSGHNGDYWLGELCGPTRWPRPPLPRQCRRSCPGWRRRCCGALRRIGSTATCCGRSSPRRSPTPVRRGPRPDGLRGR